MNETDGLMVKVGDGKTIWAALPDMTDENELRTRLAGVLALADERDAKAHQRWLDSEPDEMEWTQGRAEEAHENALAIRRAATGT